MKKISVIIPMYNVENYIAKCIGSVYNQGLNEDDFEIVLVDDESPDNCVEVAKHVTSEKNNVKIISQKNKGLGGARNTGILNASGKYLLFLDSDDWLLPDVLKDLLAIAVKDDLDVLEFAAQGITPLGAIKYHVAKNSSIMHGISYYNSVRYMNSACNKLYKTNFLRDNNLFFVERIFIEDFEFNTRTFAVAERVKATDILVGQFLQSSDSITRTVDLKKKQKMVSDIAEVLRLIDMSYAKYRNSQNAELHRFFRERLSYVCATLFVQLVKNKATYNVICHLRMSLVKENLYFDNYPIFESKKNIFRVVMMKNFWTFKISQKLIQRFYSS